MSIYEGTFSPNQRMGARSLGAFGAAALSDGILTGCEVTISAGVATISPGVIIVGGRPFRIPSSVQVGSIGAAWSRIVATVDLTRASTEDAFEQLTISIETAGTLAELMTSDSNDINLTGTTHSTWLWVYEATGSASLATYQESYRYARARSKQRLWVNPSLSSGFAAQTLILPGMDGFNSFEITFAANKSAGTARNTQAFTVPADAFLETNDTTGSPLLGQKYAKFAASRIGTLSDWTTCLWERTVKIYPAAHAIEFTTGYWSYPRLSNSSSYRGSGADYMIPLEIYGLNADRDMAP